MIIDAPRLSRVYHVYHMINELLVVCVYRGYTWTCWAGLLPYMIWYKMLVVSLCQLRYFQMENILFKIFQGVQVFRYHSWTQLDICPLWGTYGSLGRYLACVDAMSQTKVQSGHNHHIIDRCIYCLLHNEPLYLPQHPGLVRICLALRVAQCVWLIDAYAWYFTDGEDEVKWGTF